MIYGEGDAVKQPTLLRGFWGGSVERVWTENTREQFDAAGRAGR